MKSGESDRGNGSWSGTSTTAHRMCFTHNRNLFSCALTHTIARSLARTHAAIHAIHTSQSSLAEWNVQC